MLISHSNEKIVPLSLSRISDPITVYKEPRIQLLPPTYLCPSHVPLSLSAAITTCRFRQSKRTSQSPLTTRPSPSSHNKPSNHSHHSTSSTTLSPHCAPQPPLTEKEQPARSFSARLDHACLNTGPSFFSLNMGTGIASILLYNLPYNATWLQRIGIIVFVLNIVLFVLISTLSIIRYIRWKGIFTALYKHCMAGMFWGCLPMGMVTIIVSTTRLTARSPC